MRCVLSVRVDSDVFVGPCLHRRCVFVTVCVYRVRVAYAGSDGMFFQLWSRMYIVCFSVWEGVSHQVRAFCCSY